MKIKLKKENHFIQLIVFNFLSTEQINQDKKMNRGKQIICACIPNSKKISSIDFEQDYLPEQDQFVQDYNWSFY